MGRGISEISVYLFYILLTFRPYKHGLSLQKNTPYWAIGIDMYTLMCIKLMTDLKKKKRKKKTTP